jgi:hypothetical protein
MMKLTLMPKLRIGHDSGRAVTGKSAPAATPGRKNGLEFLPYVRY